MEEEEVSAEEDGEEYNPEHDASSSDEEEEIPQAERETFLSKNRKIAWSLSPCDNRGRMAAPNVLTDYPSGPCPGQRFNILQVHHTSH